MTRTIYSEARGIDARAELARPLVRERTIEGIETEVLDALQAMAESARRLTPPFQRVLAIERPPNAIEVTLDRFCGVTGLQLLRGLAKAQRLLPLPVWLGVADGWLRAVETITPSNEIAWRTAWTLTHVGADLSGAVVFTFDDFNHVLGHWPSPPSMHSTRVMGPSLPVTMSPEQVMSRPITDASRVFSMGAVLIHLLTMERPFDDDSELGRLTRIRDGAARWTRDRHPDCPPALADVLARAIRAAPDQRFPSIPAFRDALTAAAGAAAAPPEVIAGAFFGARPDRFDEVFAELASAPGHLPEAWRNGGLQVLQDRWLERRVALDTFPEDPGPAAVARPGRPRINLAPVARPSFWERLFGGTTSRRGS